MTMNDNNDNGLNDKNDNRLNDIFNNNNDKNSVHNDDDDDDDDDNHFEGRNIFFIENSPTYHQEMSFSYHLQFELCHNQCHSRRYHRPYHPSRHFRRFWRKKEKSTIFVFFFVSFFVVVASTLDMSKCRVSLGMQNSLIPDSSISASSSYDETSVGPAYGRIRTETQGGAWCPRNMISKDSYEWLQIDLGKLTVVTLVETQGRFGNGQGQEFASHFAIDYKRLKNQTWIRFKNRRGIQIFPGNTNTYIAELREVEPPIIARWVRFVPISREPKTICMRVEMYGCPWTDGLVAYDMPQGDRRGSGVDLFDFTYDGKSEDRYLSGGLGQLTDGEIGQDNFRLDPRGRGMKGYEWVGWKNSSLPLVIVFSFDSVRNFSTVVFHCNNLYSKDVQVFAEAKVFFSIGGIHYRPHSEEENISHIYSADRVMELARPVYIKLNHSLAKYIRVEFKMAARWMMISEVRFDTQPLLFPEKIPSLLQREVETTTTQTTTTTTTIIPPPVIRGLYNSSSKENNLNRINNNNNNDDDDDFLSNGDNNNNNNKTHALIPTDQSLNNKGELTIGAATQHSTSVTTASQAEILAGQYITLIIGVLSATAILLAFIVVFIIIRFRRRKFIHRRSPVNQMKIHLSDLQMLTTRPSPSNAYGNLATEEPDSRHAIVPLGPQPGLAGPAGLQPGLAAPPGLQPSLPAGHGLQPALVGPLLSSLSNPGGAMATLPLGGTLYGPQPMRGGLVDSSVMRGTLNPNPPQLPQQQQQPQQQHVCGGGIYRDPVDSVQSRKLPEIPVESTGRILEETCSECSSRDYAVPEHIKPAVLTSSLSSPGIPGIISLANTQQSPFTHSGTFAPGRFPLVAHMYGPPPCGAPCPPPCPQPCPPCPHGPHQPIHPGSHPHQLEPAHPLPPPTVCHHHGLSKTLPHLASNPCVKQLSSEGEDSTSASMASDPLPQQISNNTSILDFLSLSASQENTGSDLAFPSSTNASDLIKANSIQGVSCSTVYAIPSPDETGNSEPERVLEIPRESLKFINKLGEGQFGEVHLCECPENLEVVKPSFCLNEETQLVAVKVLRINASNHAREDFYKEVKIMSRLKDPNIVKVLGVCTSDEPLCMVVEYMIHGDLHQFLNRKVLDSAAAPGTAQDDMLSYGALVHIGLQIASGMKYLEGLNMVHRDLATRNCLVGSKNSIKIADFGMSRALYAEDYYRMEGKAMLPIRWMAWESILMGKFTPKSDAWSFAVCLWEILTFAREQPFDEMRDEQIIENLGHIFHDTGNQVYLGRPAICPKEMYDLMVQCWRRHEADRPSFREIYMFLHRKNIGFQPN